MERFFIIFECFFASLVGSHVTAADANKNTSASVVEIIRMSERAADSQPGSERLMSEIAHAFARANDLTEALRVYDKIGTPEMRRRAGLGILFARARAGKVDDVLRISEMIGGDNTDNAIAIVAAHFASAGDVGESRRIISSLIKSENSRLYALRLVADCRKEAGDLSSAIQILESIPSPIEKARARHLTGVKRLRDGDFAGAALAADETRVMIRGIESREARDGVGRHRESIDPELFRTPLLKDIALAQAVADKTEACITTAESIDSTYWKAITLARLSSIRAKAGDKRSAKALIDRANSIAPKISGRGFVMSEIGTSQYLMGEVEESRKTFIKALDLVGPTINQSNVIYSQAHAGDFDGALKTVAGITNVEAKLTSYEFIAAAMANAGDFIGPLQVVALLRNPNEQASAFLAISRVQFDAGKRKDAATTLLRAAEIKGSINGQALRTITCALAESGDTDGAMTLVLRKATPATKALGLLGIAEGLLPPIRIAKYPMDNP